MFFDTHCHLDLDDSGWREVITRASDAKVTRMNHIAEQESSWDEAIQIAEAYPENIIATLGVHPNHVHEEYYQQNIDKVFALLETKVKSPCVHAIGEAGLDYYYLEKITEKENISVDRIKEIQKEYFTRFIELAHRSNKTLVMHCRDGSSSAYQDFYEVLKDNFKAGQRGVVHFYIGDTVMLQKFLDLGLYIGYTGVVTFPNTDSYAENIRLTPLDRIVIETDSPFVAPQAHRGQKNEPAYVVEVAKRISEIKNISIEEVANHTFENGLKLFDI